MSESEANWLDHCGQLLAKTIDDLFIKGFGFKPKDAPGVMKHFCFVENTLYITCFEEPKFVLSYYCDSERIRIRRISNIKAMTWGWEIKNKLKISSSTDNRKPAGSGA